MKAFPKYNSYKDSEIEWLGEIPEHWDISNIRAVTELKSEKNKPELQVLSVYREYGVIKKDSRNDNHNATSLDTSTYKVVKPGDLVVNKMKAWQGSMGISEYEGVVSPAYITCKTHSEKVNPKYLHYLLRSKAYIGIYNSLSYGVRVGQWDMHYEDFKKIELPIAPREEQDGIVKFLDSNTKNIETIVKNKKYQLGLMREFINTMVLTGSLDARPIKRSDSWLGDFPVGWEIKKAKRIFLESNIKNKPMEQLLAVTQDRGVLPKESCEQNYVSPSGDVTGLKLVQSDNFVISLRSFQGGIEHSIYRGIVSPAYNVFYLRNEYLSKPLVLFFKYLFKTDRFIELLNTVVSGIRDGKNINFADFAELEIPLPLESDIEFMIEYFELYENMKNEYDVFKYRLNEIKDVLIQNVVFGKIKI